MHTDSSYETREVDWKCDVCGEDCPNSFDYCWNCGSSPHGQRDDSVHTIGPIEQGQKEWTDPLWTYPNWSIRGMFAYTTFFALYLGAFSYLDIKGRIVITAILLPTIAIKLFFAND